MADVIRKALQTIILYRDGSQKMVTPGEIVTLTEKEHNEQRQFGFIQLTQAIRVNLAQLEKTTASDSKAEPDKTQGKAEPDKTQGEAEPDKTQGKGGKAGTRAKEEEL